uniref:Uncharacterized protein n=1 Tax=Romanomermis culicivorax TaxID=13658 RepID=A0A915KHF2_ROMCU
MVIGVAEIFGKLTDGTIWAGEVGGGATDALLLNPFRTNSPALNASLTRDSAANQLKKQTHQLKNLIKTEEIKSIEVKKTSQAAMRNLVAKIEDLIFH